jgi:hypothetical protein
MEPGTLELCHNYTAPDMSLEDFKLWCRRYAYAFCFDADAFLNTRRKLHERYSQMCESADVEMTHGFADMFRGG